MRAATSPSMTGKAKLIRVKAAPSNAQCGAGNMDMYQLPQA